MIDIAREGVIIDFETPPIESRPQYPPAPVGVALDFPGEKPKYLAWGHPTGGNTHTWADGRRELLRAYESGRPLIYHNAKFDVCVTEEQMGLPRLPHDRYHDTMPALFLVDPRAPTYALKPASEKLLDLPPEERDAVEDWLMEHQPVPGRKLSKARSSDNYVGKFIAWAPPRLVGPYAIGDVKRTRKLLAYCLKYLRQRQMLEAYDTERLLLLDLLDMENEGVRIDLARLSRDIERYEDERRRLEAWLCKRLRCAPDTNWASGAEAAEAFIRGGVASAASLGVTATGKVQTNKAALDQGVTDPQVLSVFRYRVQLSTCLDTFMKPWHAMAERSGGLIYTTWHSTRNDESGTRTGRLSSTPNFQNIPKVFKPLFKVAGDETTAKLPRQPFEVLPLPSVRGYVVPYDQGEVLLDRDYSQQELRILAHFEGGALLEAYLKDPWLDLHEHARQLVNTMLHANYDRKPIKNTVFGLIYGMGIGKLALQNDLDVDTSRKIKSAILESFTGIKDINKEMRERAKRREPIRTIGGREYYCEEPKWIDGELRTFDYKLINLLIQGSASDETKRAVLRFRRLAPRRWRLYFNVHDQLTVSAPKHEMHEAMATLKHAMEGSPRTDVPLLSEGSWGMRWDQLKDYDKKGKQLMKGHAA